MKPRHARQIRAGIRAARQNVRPVMFACDLMAAAYKREVRRLNKKAYEEEMRIAWGKYANRPYKAAETFTHPTTPTAADKAAKPDRSSQEGQS